MSNVVVSKGRYRILTTIRQPTRPDGFCAFAEVWVCEGPNLTQDVPIDGVDPRGNYETWKEAARDGVRRGIERAQSEFGVYPAALRVESIRATVIDSREDTIECAAEAATYSALGWPAAQIAIKHDGRAWSVLLEGPPSEG